MRLYFIEFCINFYGIMVEIGLSPNSNPSEKSHDVPLDKFSDINRITKSLEWILKRKIGNESISSAISKNEAKTKLAKIYLEQDTTKLWYHQWHWLKRERLLDAIIWGSKYSNIEYNIDWNWNKVFTKALTDLCQTIYPDINLNKNRFSIKCKQDKKDQRDFVPYRTRDGHGGILCMGPHYLEIFLKKKES